MKVRIARRAEKELLDLPQPVQRRFRSAMDSLAQTWPVVVRDAKRLQGRPNAWRLRVGDYRALFESTEDTLFFTAFVSRSTAYR